MKFDKIITAAVNNFKIQYGIIFGNEKIIFIKSGADGDIRGYEDKYIRMAHLAHEKSGATVICASNPDVIHDRCDIRIIRKIIKECNFENSEIFFIGTSDGAYRTLLLANNFSETVKVLGINMSFISLSDLKEKIITLHNVEKIFVYGSDDDEFSEVVPMLRKMESDNIKIVILDGVDHRFTGMTKKFISLIELIL